MHLFNNFVQTTLTDLCLHQAENQQLRVELETRTTTSPPSPGISPIEAQIIAQLETSISCLAEQVEIMEHENSAANIAEEA